MIYQYKKITAIIFLAFLFFPSFTSLAMEEEDVHFLMLHSIHPASFPVPVRDKEKGIIIQEPDIMGHQGPWVKIIFSSSQPPEICYLKLERDLLDSHQQNVFKFKKNNKNENMYDELLDINFKPFFQHKISLKWQDFNCDCVCPCFKLLPKDIMWSILSILALDHPRAGIIPLMYSCRLFKNLLSAKVTEEVGEIQKSLEGFKYRFPPHYLDPKNCDSWNERRLISPVQQNQLLWGSWCGNSDAKLLLLETTSNFTLEGVREFIDKMPFSFPTFHTEAARLQFNINFLDHLIKSCDQKDKVLLSHLCSEYLGCCPFYPQAAEEGGTAVAPLHRCLSKCFPLGDREQLEKIASYLKNCVQHDYHRITRLYFQREKDFRLVGQSFIGCLLNTFLTGNYNRPILPETGKMRPRTAEEKEDDINIVGDLMIYWKKKDKATQYNIFEEFCYNERNPYHFLYAGITEDKERLLQSFLSDSSIS